MMVTYLKEEAGAIAEVGRIEDLVKTVEVGQSEEKLLALKSALRGGMEWIEGVGPNEEQLFDESITLQSPNAVRILKTPSFHSYICEAGCKSLTEII